MRGRTQMASQWLLAWPVTGLDPGQGKMRAAAAMASVVVGAGLVARDGELAGVPGVCIGV